MEPFRPSRLGIGAVPKPTSLGTRIRGLLPRTAYGRDAIVFSGICVALYFVLGSFDMYERLDELVHAHEDWNLDDIVLTVLISAFVLAIFSYRRIRELNVEVKARVAAEAEALLLARHDPLTGLPNRRGFSELLETVLRPTLDQGARVAVLMIDLDGFKQINDVHGHAVGDLALIQTAERISVEIRDDTVLARLGGDEFAIIMPNISSPEDSTGLARRIIAALAEPFMIGSTGNVLSAGIGIAIAPDDGTETDELLRRADRALYRAKADGRSRIRYFEPNMDAHVERRVLIEREMRAVLERGKIIVPHYQPIVSLDGNGIIGFEALARWQHPELGALPPAVFIPIAEESGMIGALSDDLLRQACKVARHWPKELTLSFNISPIQLRDRTLGLRILAILGETGFDARQLELEITESALVDHSGIGQTVINDLRAAGVRIALDDFGTGYATLSQLLALHVDKLKIDRSFVERLGKDTESSVIVRAIIGLAKGFGLTTTAEGIEDREQLAYLKENGCVEGQGFLFSKAVPAKEIPALLEQARRKLQVA